MDRLGTALAIAATLLLVGCRYQPKDFDPRHAGVTLDAAAKGCLDWAWFETDYVNEVGGGLYKTPTGYACSELTVGDRTGVTFSAFRRWVAILHTHSRGPNVFSGQDMSNVRNDPKLRPSYVRFRSGSIAVYECRKDDTDRIKCVNRRVR